MFRIKPRRTIGHVQVYGQSTAVGYNANGALTTGCPGFHRTFNGGPIAIGEGTMDSLRWHTEVSVETPCGGMAHYLARQRRWDRKLFSTAGKSGWTIDLLRKGSAWYPNLMAQIENGHRLVTRMNHWYDLQAFVFLQGFSDQCTYFTPQATYLEKLRQLRIDVELDAESITKEYFSDLPMFIYQLSVGMAAPTPRRTVTLAQLEAHEIDPYICITHPGYVPRRSDWIHYNNCGSRMAGYYVGRAIWKRLTEGYWSPLRPLNVVGGGSEIVVTLEVPEPPIAIDTQWISEVQDYGFAVEDDSGQRTINSIAVTDDDEVTININGTLNTNPRLRHGFDYRAPDSNLGGTTYKGAEGNIRDTSADVYWSSMGEKLNLNNWLLHFDKPITT